MAAHETRGGVDLGRRVLQALVRARGDADASDAVLRAVGECSGAALTTLWLRDDATGLLVFKSDWAPDDELEAVRRVKRRLTFAPGVGLPGMVVETGVPFLVPDLSHAEGIPRAELLREAGLRSGVAVPVAAPDGVLGVLEQFHRLPGRPEDEDLDDLAMAADQLGTYLARLRVEDRLRISEESAASIVQAALDCVVTMDHRGRVVDFNPAAEQTFGYTRDDVVGRTLSELIIPPRLRELHRTALVRYVETGQATILGRRLELTGMRADGSELPVELTVTRLGTSEPPLFAGFLRDISERRSLEQEQSRALREALLARAQAEAAGVRADVARHEAERASREEQRARERMAVLARAGRIMSESMDWETTLRAVVRSAVPAVADWSALTVVEPGGRLRVVAVAHEDPGREEQARELLRRFPPLPDAPTGMARVIATGQPAVLADLGPDELRREAGGSPDHLELLERLDTRHIAITPLQAASGVIGAMAFVRADPVRPFTPEDLDLVTSLGARAALHLQNARLYTERSHIAATLQASLRPRALPRIPGADLAARFLPAGDQHEVGGDFYDVFVSGDGVWTAVIGDVSGKGPEAAAITALARHTLRTASMLEDDPAANLGLLNRALQADSPEWSFCTVFYARVCPRDAREGGLDVRFANGGHPSPLVLRADGGVEEVEAGRGPLVGALPEVSFPEATLTLHPGDLLLLYTDGITEVRTSDVGLGERELRAAVARLAGATAREVVDAVTRRALELQGGGQRDDIAAVALRAEAPPS